MLKKRDKGFTYRCYLFKFISSWSYCLLCICSFRCFGSSCPLLSKQTDYSSTIVVVELLMGLEGTKVQLTAKAVVVGVMLEKTQVKLSWMGLIPH